MQSSAGKRNQRFLERIFGLDRESASGDAVDVCEIAAEQVQWTKTADRPSRRQQFDGRRTAAMHDGPSAFPGRRLAGSGECVRCRTDAVIQDG
ncbi:hypothetical protein H3V53_28275 [Paraburkholderia bengalensis]|uniref:Uncharacterized protein n=1 Tax=Paraburkholderia bengalensis TaxID=2747562 RepID=A0ABU8IZ50_9BURK